MKAKKLAAYTLATCMTVTVAPIGAVTPIMAEEVEMYGATVVLPKEMKVSIETKITAGMKYKDAVNKVILNDISESGSVGTLVSEKIKIKNGANVLYDSSATYDNDDASNASYKEIPNFKFEVGKKYTIEAEFDITGYDVQAGTTVNVDGNKATVTATNGADAVSMTAYTLDLTTSSTTAKLDDYPDANGGSGKYAYRTEKGDVLTTTTTVAKNKDGWFYVKDGYKAAPASPLIVENAYGKWLVNKTTGDVTFDKTGLAKDADGNIWYVKDSKVDTSMTGVIEISAQDETAELDADLGAGKYNVVNGKLAKGVTVAHEKSTGDWLYVDKNGKVDGTFDGFCANANGTWVVEDGKVNFKASGIIEDTNKKVADTVKDYYVSGGKIDFTKNGTVFVNGTGLKTIKNGVVDTTAKLPSITVVQGTGDDAGKWYAIGKDGSILDNNEVKFATNAYGTWVIKGSAYGDDAGTVNFDAEDFIADSGADISTDNTKIYYVKGGKVQYGVSGIVDLGMMGIANVENGVVTGTKNDVIHDKKSGKWYCIDENGYVASRVDEPAPDDDQWYAVNRLATNKNGTWYIDDDGKVDFKKEGFFKLIDVTDDDSTYYIKDGKVQTSKTGWVKVGEDLRYVISGKVSAPKTATVAQAPDGIWYAVIPEAEGYPAVDNDDPTQGFAGIVKNAYGTWYVYNGKVEFDKTGIFQDNDNVVGNGKNKSYYFEKSKLVLNKTGIIDVDGDTAENDGDLVYFENGVKTGRKAADSVVQFGKDWYSINADGDVDRDNDKMAANKYGIWHVTAGKVDFTFEGFETVDANDVKLGNLPKGEDIYFKNGKFQSTLTGLVKRGNNYVYVKNGVVTTDGVTDIIQAADGNWYFVKDGAIDTGFTGVAENANGKWYVESGIVNFDKTGIVAADSSDSTKGEYYVVKGKMTGDVTGFVTVGSQKFYVEKNKVTGSKVDNRVIHDSKSGKWYYVDSTGEVKQPASNFGRNSSGVWFIGTDGAVDFKKDGLVVVPANDAECNLTANESVTVKAGKVDKNIAATGFIGDDYYENGVKAAGKTGIVEGKFIKNGTVSESTEVFTDSFDSKVKYVVDGKLPTKSGIVADTTNSSAKTYFVNGVRTTTVTGVITDEFSSNAKTFVTDGVIESSAGIKTDSDGVKWNVDASSIVTPGVKDADVVADSEGNKCFIGDDGKVVTNYTGYGADASNYYCFKNGVIDVDADAEDTFTYYEQEVTKTFNNGVATK